MRFALDHNRLYAVEVTKTGDVWHARLALPGDVFPPLANKLRNLVVLEDAGGERHAFAAEDPLVIRGGAFLNFSVDGHPFGVVRQRADGTLHATRNDCLTVTETRLMGELPWASGVCAARGDGSANGAIFTDFHTHSSSEISGEGLVGLAFTLGVRYPVRLLKKLGIDTEGRTVEMIDRVRFPPLEPPSLEIPRREDGVDIRDLRAAERGKLAYAMDMPADRQSAAGSFDLRCYPFRYPLTKHPRILEESYREIARRYRQNGIRYAEITITSPVSAASLRILHRVVPDIERESGVHLRFLLGIPRTFGKPDLHASLEKAKILARSPYIMGIDIIGYETNKTGAFDAELRTFAGWMRRHHPEFTLRVHAGENMKNPENIRHILEIARDTGVRIRVGHAIYGVDEDTLNLAEILARKGQLVLEFNPDSNIALNNIDTLETIPFRESAARRIPFVVGSDGSGFYRTSARQLEKNLEHLGLDTAALELLRESQRALLDRQLRYGREKETALAELEEMIAGCAALPPSPAAPEHTPPNNGLPEDVTALEGGEPPDHLKDKRPVLLVGASGSTWTRMSPEDRREAAIAVDMLARTLDPEKVYFVTGRVKKEGLAAELYAANDRLRRESKPAFEVAALHENNFLVLPQRLANFSTRHGGELIALGGGAFTRDIILSVKHNNILADTGSSESGDPRKAHYFVMKNIGGASKEKAEMLTRKYQADNAVGLIRRMAKFRQDWFLPELVEHGLDKTEVHRLYRESERRAKEKSADDAFVH